MPARDKWLTALLVLGVAFSVTPWASPPVALALGLLLAVGLGNPYAKRTTGWAKKLLQASVVGLGFGIPLARVLEAGSTGVLYTVLGIALAIALGLLLGRAFRVERETSWLVTGGTAICGGSAIAAIGASIRARSEAMSVALATVFVLNAVALYAFPPVGAYFAMSQDQFAVWAAVAIHDTASVVGAAAVYGAEALETATVLKLARALWIAPLALLAAWYVRREAQRAGKGKDAHASTPIPWFIGLFILAALARTLVPAGEPAFDFLARAARQALVVTLFLIGASLTRASLAAVGARPLVQGLVLWVVMSVVTLFAVLKFVPA